MSSTPDATQARPQYWSTRRRVLVVLLVVALAVGAAVGLLIQRYAHLLSQSVALGAVVGALGSLAVCVAGGYMDSWTWTGFGRSTQGKTLWDAVDVLILPAVLAFGVVLLNEWQTAAEKMRSDKQASVTAIDTKNVAYDAVLGGYLSQISDLILKHKLASQPTDDVRAIARARTLSALLQLDPSRQSIVVRFLSESNLLPYVDLSIVNLQGVSLQGFILSCEMPPLPQRFCTNLRWAWLNKNTDLSFTHLAYADLSNAHLHGANLSHADLFCAYSPTTLRFTSPTQQGKCPRVHACSPTTQRLTHRTQKAKCPRVQAWLNGADLSNADLEYTNLSNAELSDANLSYANLSHAVLSDAVLSHTLLIHTNLSGAHLNGAGLSHTLLIHTNLSGAHLNGAGLSGAIVIGANLSGVHWDGHTICPDSTNSATNGTSPKPCDKHLTPRNFDLKGVNFTGVDLTCTNLACADLTRANLTGANLTRANLSGDNLSGANLSGVHWDHTICPDSTNSTTNSPKSCVGHLRPLTR